MATPPWLSAPVRQAPARALGNDRRPQDRTTGVPSAKQRGKNTIALAVFIHFPYLFARSDFHAPLCSWPAALLELSDIYIILGDGNIT
jgi:hypothetical protein